MLNGVELELFPDRITYMSMFNDIEHWQREYEESCLKETREVVSFANRLRIGHWCFCGPAEDRTWWHCIRTDPKEMEMLSRWKYHDWLKTTALVRFSLVLS